VISAAAGPAAAKAKTWSLRNTPGNRQNVSATTPRLETSRRARWLEWLVVRAQPRRHYQSGVGTERIAQGLDQAERPSVHGPRRPEGCVHEQDTARLDPECTQLTGDLAPRERALRICARCG
jgi:hypothetical protein